VSPNTNQRLKEARAARDLTQTELAERLGVPQPSVARWETGGTLPSLKLALAVARELETSVEAIWGEDER
jgi:putative transcriptional regulator